MWPLFFRGDCVPDSGAEADKCSVKENPLHRYSPIIWKKGTLERHVRHVTIGEISSAEFRKNDQPQLGFLYFSTIMAERLDIGTIKRSLVETKYCMYSNV